MIPLKFKNRLALILLLGSFVISSGADRLRRDGEEELAKPDESSAAGPSRVASSTPPEFIQEALNVHNAYRKLHHVPDLVINNTLNEVSQAYANKLAADGVTLDTYENPDAVTYGLGENFYEYSANTLTKKPNPANVLEKFYEGVKDYNFKTGEGIDGRDDFPSFTQVVWKGSTQFGISYATVEKPNEDGKYITFVVANYWPKGNEDGQFTNNVFPKNLDGAPDSPNDAGKPGSGTDSPGDGGSGNSPRGGGGTSFDPFLGIAIGCLIIPILLLFILCLRICKKSRRIASEKKHAALALFSSKEKTQVQVQEPI